MTIAYNRAYIKSTDKKPKGKYKSRKSPRRVLVIDVVRTNDTKQELVYGFYMLLRPKDKILERYEAFTTTATDELLTINQKSLLQDSMLQGRIDAAHKLGYKIARHPSNVLALEHFRNRLFKYMSKEGCMVVGYDLPIILTSLASSYTRCRSGSSYQDGFSLCLCDFKESKYKKQVTHKNGTSSIKTLTKRCYKHPRIMIKHLGNNKSMIVARQPRYGDYSNVYFVDVATLSGAILGEVMELEYLSADGLVLPIDNRYKEPDSGDPTDRHIIEATQQRLIATFACYEKLHNIYKGWHLDKPLHHLLSSASLAKALLDQLGIIPFSEKHPDFPEHMMAWSISAYYGGRNTMGIRREPARIIYHDVKSEYLTVAAIMKIQDFMTAEHIEVVDTTDQVQKLLAMSKDDLIQWCLDKNNWPVLRCLVQIVPNHHMLPVRSMFSEVDLTVGFSVVKSSSEPLIYALSDIIVAT